MKIIHKIYCFDTCTVHRDLSVAKKSILGTILPEAMVNILHNYGADRLGINCEAHSYLLVICQPRIYILLI